MNFQTYLALGVFCIFTALVAEAPFMFILGGAALLYGFVTAMMCDTE